MCVYRINNNNNNNNNNNSDKRNERGDKVVECCSSIFGVISLASLFTAFVSSPWVYTLEPFKVPNTHPNLYTTITFKIGLWKVCHLFTNINSTIILPLSGCTSIGYPHWTADVTYTDLGIAYPIEFTTTFLSDFRLTVWMFGIGLALLVTGFAYLLAGHCYEDNKMAVASALLTLSGLFSACGLFVFVCVLTQNFELTNNGNRYSYKYGWCFFVAGISSISSEVTAALCVSTYYKRIQTINNIIRVMIPENEDDEINKSVTEEIIGSCEENNISQETNNEGVKVETPIIEPVRCERKVTFATLNKKSEYSGEVAHKYATISGRLGIASSSGITECVQCPKHGHTSSRYVDNQRNSSPAMRMLHEDEYRL